MIQPWTVRLIPKAADEVDALSNVFKARFLRIASLVEQFGPTGVGMPHVRHLERELWEMRMKATPGIARAIYVVGARRDVWVLHAFLKKTQKTPRRHIDIARGRIRDIPQ